MVVNITYRYILFLSRILMIKQLWSQRMSRCLYMYIFFKFQNLYSNLMSMFLNIYICNQIYTCANHSIILTIRNKTMIKRFVLSINNLNYSLQWFSFPFYTQTKTPKRRQWRKSTVWTTEVLYKQTNKQTNKQTIYTWMFCF